jgi:hypothetical protein
VLRLRLWSCVWLERAGPRRADQTVYLVVDRFGDLGTVYRETDIERTDLETVITDLMSGQFDDPVRVVAFNTLEHWAQDVSRDVALEIQSRCDIDGHDIPEAFRDFVIAMPVPIGSSPCSWHRPCLGTVPSPNPFRSRVDRLPARCANYIKKLSKPERNTPEWRLAVRMPIDAAEDRGPMLFAKIGILRAVEHHVERRQRGGHLPARKSVSVKRLEG